MSSLDSQTIWQRRFLDSGLPEVDDFEILSSSVSTSLLSGELLVRVSFMSVDPYLRWRLKSTSVSGASPCARKPMEGYVSGIVLASANPAWTAGDLFGGHLVLSTVQTVSAERTKTMWKLTGLVDEATLSRGIGVLGMPGSTAYAGVIGVLRPEEKGEKGEVEVILVSAAAGAVGSIAGQIAKNVVGLRVIGVCGGKEKCQLVKEKFGYDEAVDYREIETQVEDGGKGELVRRIKEVAPEGIDMYFENVGGFHFDAAFESLREGGRIAVCGVVSQYNDAEFVPNKINLSAMIYPHQRIEGFVCHPWLYGKKGNFLQDMSKWIKEGLIANIEETVYDGIMNWPTAFRSLFANSQQNKGKVVVRI